MGYYFPGVAQSGCDVLVDMTNGRIAKYNTTAEQLVDSPLWHDTTEGEVVSDLPIRVPPGTLYIGNQLGLDDSGGYLIYNRKHDADTTFIPVTLNFDATGTVEYPFVSEFATLVEEYAVNTDETSETTATSHTHTETATANEFLSSVYYKIGTTAPTANVTFKVYLDSVSADNLIIDETYPSSDFAVDTMFEKALNPHIAVLEGRDVVFVWSSTVAFSLKGDGAGLPWFSVDRQTADFYRMLDVRDIADYGEVKMFALSMSGAVTKANLISRGWAICDGTTPASQGITSPIISAATPDLQHKFIRMSDDESSGGTGGEDEHTLTVDEIPAHTHEIACSVDAGSTSVRCGDNGSYAESEATGGGLPHNNLPTYYELAFFIKVK